MKLNPKIYESAAALVLKTGHTTKDPWWCCCYAIDEAVRRRHPRLSESVICLRAALYREAFNGFFEPSPRRDVYFFGRWYEITPQTQAERATALLLMAEIARTSSL